MKLQNSKLVRVGFNVFLSFIPPRFATSQAVTFGKCAVSRQSGLFSRNVLVFATDKSHTNRDLRNWEDVPSMQFDLGPKTVSLITLNEELCRDEELTSGATAPVFTI